jgi:hypothetical protein
MIGMWGRGNVPINVLRRARPTKFDFRKLAHGAASTFEKTFGADQAEHVMDQFTASSLREVDGCNTKIGLSYKFSFSPTQLRNIVPLIIAAVHESICFTLQPWVET